MNLLECILEENPCYKARTTITPKGVMVHSTGANNPNLKRYVQPSPGQVGYPKLMGLLGINRNMNDWNRKDIKVCVHAFIGKLADGSVATVQTLPWNRKGWHAGSGKKGSANDTHISFEICEDNLTNKDYFEKVYLEAVELTASLCKMYGLDPKKKGVVICHSEGCDMGIASNHGDVMHWFPKHGKDMDDFRADVAKELEANEVKVYKTINDVPDWAKPTIKKLMNKGALKGTDNKGSIDVDETYVRVMVTLDRLGKLG